MSSSGAVDFGSHVFKDLSNHHSKAVLHLRWSGDGSYLSSASNDKTVKLTQVDTTGVAKVAQTISYIANQVAWHPQDQRFLLSGDDKSMEVWDVRRKYYLKTEVFKNRTNMPGLRVYFISTVLLCLSMGRVYYMIIMYSTV